MFAWPRGPIRSADNIGTALLLELPDRAAADKFWNEEPFAKNGGYRQEARITRRGVGGLAVGGGVAPPTTHGDERRAATRLPPNGAWTPPSSLAPPSSPRR